VTCQKDSTVRYWTIREFVEARSRRQAVIGRYLVVLVVSAAITWMMSRPTSSAVVVEGLRASIDLNSRGNETRFSKWDAAAHSALSKWTATGVTVPEFRLVAADGGCTPKAIACADESTKTIFVMEDGDHVDRTTIMMHEIGHLLGVPHIDGDLLMDKAYSGKALSAPTEFAIALARKVNRVDGGAK
jgi:hypothetical protein